MNEIQISLDEQGTKPISTIQWNEGLMMELVGGVKVPMPNVATPNQNVEASFFLINNTLNRFGIKSITFPDPRIQINLSGTWIIKDTPVKVTLKYRIPNNPTKNDVIKPANLEISGFFVIE
jgi:hypothetical protein